MWFLSLELRAARDVKWTYPKEYLQLDATCPVTGSLTALAKAYYGSAFGNYGFYRTHFALPAEGSEFLKVCPVFFRKNQ